MLEIRLYNNFAENNRVDKTHYLSLDYRYQGLLREPSSVMTPQVDIEVTDDSLQDMLRCNYAYITMFNRYYYITDMVNISNSIWRLYMRVDVLMSFKDHIGFLEAYVARNEYDYSETLPDVKFPCESGNEVEFVTGSLMSFARGSLYSSIGVPTTAYCAVLTISSDRQNIPSTLGIDNLSQFNSTYIFTMPQIYRFLAYITQASVWNNFNWLFANPTENLISLKILPIDVSYELPDDYLTDTIRIGHVDVGSTELDEQDNPFGKVYHINQPLNFKLFSCSFNYTPYNNAKFLSYEPYINAQLYLPYKGFVDFDTNLFNTNGTISFSVMYNIDITTGKCAVVLTKETSYDHTLYPPRAVYECDISVDVPLGFTNKSEIERNKILAGIQLATAAIDIGTTFAGNTMAVDNLVGRATKRTTPNTKLGRQIANAEMSTESDLAMGTSNAVASFAVNYIKGSQVHIQGGATPDGFLKGLPYYNYLYTSTSSTVRDNFVFPIIIVKKLIPLYTTVTDLTKYAHMVGRPLNRLRQLSTVYGYTEIAGIHLEWSGSVRSMSQEREEIYELLKTGVMFPEPPET